MDGRMIRSYSQMNKTPQLHRKPVCNTHCLHAPVHVRQLICQGLSPYHTAAVSHSCCVPDWHNHSLILLTWSAFLFSLKLLSDTCPGQMDPRPFRQCNTYAHTCTPAHIRTHTLDLRRLINPGDFSYLIPSFQPFSVTDESPSRSRTLSDSLCGLEIKIDWCGAFTFFRFTMQRGLQCISRASVILLQLENSFTKLMGLSDLKNRIIIKHYWGAPTSHCSEI